VEVKLKKIGVYKMDDNTSELKTRSKLFDDMLTFMECHDWDQERCNDTINNMATMSNAQIQGMMDYAKSIVQN